MQVNTLFCSVDWLKANTPLELNIDSELIRPVLLNAQYFHIYPQLGTGLYNRICSDVTGGTLSGDYLTLMNVYITPCLKEAAVLELLPYLAYHLNNKSVGKRKSDTTDPATLDELYYLAETCRSNTGFYKERLKRYLIANTDKFPEYNNPGPGADTIPPVRETYFSGFHIAGYLPEQFSSFGQWNQFRNFIGL